VTCQPYARLDLTAGAPSAGIGAAATWAGGDTIDFSTREPLGAAPTTTEFGGEVYDRDGRRVPGGSRVEAYIGEELCGVASVRWSDVYILTVAGPDSLPGCVAGGTITFR
jgi:hypothetical protein